MKSGNNALALQKALKPFILAVTHYTPAAMAQAQLGAVLERFSAVQAEAQTVEGEVVDEVGFRI